MMKIMTSEFLRNWAYNNALLLVVMTLMFFVTWITFTVAFWIWVWSR